MLFITGCSLTGEKSGISLTATQLMEEFNKLGEERGYALKALEKNADGTFALRTSDDNARVECIIDNGKVTRVDVYGFGIFQPGLASYDFMPYIMMSCDDSVDWLGAADFVADLYYEATSGQDAVVTAFNGLQYEFYKGDFCRFTVKNP